MCSQCGQFVLNTYVPLSMQKVRSEYRNFVLSICNSFSIQKLHSHYRKWLKVQTHSRQHLLITPVTTTKSLTTIANNDDNKKTKTVTTPRKRRRRPAPAGWNRCKKTTTTKFENGYGHTRKQKRRCIPYTKPCIVLFFDETLANLNQATATPTRKNHSTPHGKP